MRDHAHLLCLCRITTTRHKKKAGAVEYNILYRERYIDREREEGRERERERERDSSPNSDGDDCVTQIVPGCW